MAKKDKIYAIIRTGSKQYTVQPEDVLEVEHLDAKTGDKVALQEVLLVNENDKNIHIGQPLVDGAAVNCEVVETLRGEKVLAFRFRRRKNIRKLRGHRQLLTRLKVKEISLKA